MSGTEIETTALLAIPLLNSLLVLIAHKSKTFTILSSSVLSLLTLILLILISFNRNLQPVMWNWLSIGSHPVNLIFEFNSLTIPIAIMVSFISFLVTIYSIGFFKWDTNQSRYYSTLSLFTFSMLGLTLSGNLLQTFVFWELVGLSSYLLISFYRTKPEAGAASTKALIMNKIGDAGFIIALMAIYDQSGTFEISVLESLTVSSDYTLVIGVGLLLAVFSKSAQFPFHTWLPDAMEGPTPISALIHSATMVAAGVYLLVRVPFFFTPELLHVISIIGTVTALIGGINALHEKDLKKVLAWSTVSQLGLMVMVAGQSGFSAAYIYLLSHAVFKAGLFLVAGILISNSMSSNISDISYSEKSRALFLAATLLCVSLMGFPLTIGFLSKEYLLSSISSPTFLGLLFLLNMISVFYSARIFSTVYPLRKTSGKSRIESTYLIIPVIVLAICSIWILYSPSPLTVYWINEIWNLHSPSDVLTISSMAWVLLWSVIAWYMVKKNKINSFTRWIPTFKMDNSLHLLFVKPILFLSAVTNNTDDKIINKGLHGFAYVNLSLALMARWLDENLVDGLVRFSSWLVRGIGNLIRRFVAGRIQGYIWWTLVTLAILFILSR